jgi:hypothetical protein
MKYGKAVAKEILPIHDEAMSYIERELKKLGEAYNMWVEIDKQVNNYLKYAEGGFSVIAYFKPKAYTEKTIRHPKTKSRLSLLDIPNDTPYIVVDLTYNASVDEVTGEHVNQYHYFTSTHDFIEIPYRCRNVEAFSGYNSFDYDTDTAEIIESIKESVKAIAEAYKPLFK